MHRSPRCKNIIPRKSLPFGTRTLTSKRHIGDNCSVYVNCVIRSHRNHLIFPLLLLIFVLNIRILTSSFYPVGAKIGRFIIFLVVYIL